MIPFRSCLKLFRRCFALAAVMLSGVMSLTPARANVTLTDNGNGTVTMNNGIVTMTCSKTGGDVSYFALNTLASTNLINPSQDYGLSLTHIGSGTNDYWVGVGGGGTGAIYSVVTNNGQIVDVMIRNPLASGNTALYPNGLWDWAEHHVMRAGEAGFYTYHVWRHWANQPAAYYWADSWQGRCGSIFDTTTNANGSVNYAWDFSSSDVPIGLSINTLPPAQTNNDGVPAEVAVLPYTSFVTQPTGNYYEPGWPIYTQPLGLTSDLHPCTTKYDQSSYQGASNTFRPVWGMATDQIGLWSILGSFEFINGGPTKQKGAVSGDYMYNDDLEGHGLGSVPNPGAAAGEIFTKVIGPYFMYANSGTNHLQLWTNAQNIASQMVSNWPYAWMNESEQDYPRHRGTVMGTLKAKTGESTANAVVILGDYTDGDWIFQGATNFIFWTTSDTNGNFSIPKIRPGNYQLFSYVPGIWGELQISNIVVLPDATNNLGVINWNPPHLAQRLWRVGTPDHSSKEFHLGNYPKQFGLWWRYLNDKSTNDVNFVIGQSVESNDWYYAQCSVGITPQSYPNLTDHTQTNGNYWSPHWNVIFNLTNLPPTNVLFTVAFAGGNGTYFYTYINGVNATPTISGVSDPYHGVGTTSGVDIYRDVVTVGRYQYYQFPFPSNLFVVGTNTFTITIRQPGAPGSWTGTYYPELVQGGLIYDFLQMETGPQIILSTPPAAPTGLNATAVSGCEIDLSWTNNATNATSLEILRSTDNSNFSQIGAVFNTATNYADTSLPTSTTYYYRVVANNANGNSPNSNTAQASTQAAQPPATPSGLTATGVATNQINLTWGDNSTNEDGFNIARSTNGGNYTSIGVVTAGITNYSDTGLATGTTYFYRVQAFRSCWGNSSYSTPVTAATLVPPAPVTPVGLVAIPGNGKISLSWLAASGAGSYNLKRGTSSGAETNLLNTTGTSYTDTAVVNGTTYYYVVSSLNAGGEGNNSREASATPMAFVSAFWTNLVTSSPQSWDVNANWTNLAAYPNATGIVVNITANIAAPQTNNVDQSITLGWLNIGDANGSLAFTLMPNGGSLTFKNGTNNNAGLIELSTSAGDTIAAPITISNNLTILNISTAKTLTLTGTISGPDNVTYVGPGSFLLATNNTYSGATLISGATVTLANYTANVSAFGSANTVTLDQGTLSLNSNNNTPPGPFSNIFYWNMVVPTNSTGTLNGDGRCYMNGTLTGGGTLNIYIPYVRMELDGNWSAFTGQINASGSDFRFNNTYGLANAALALNGDSAYSLNGSVTVGEISGNSTAYLTATAWTVGSRNSTANFAGVITGNSITKIGTGVWILSGDNTYTGTTTISGGALQIGAGGNSGLLGTGNVTDNAALVFNRFDSVICSNLISGAGSLAQAGNGVLILTAANTYSGATYVTAGMLALTNAASIANSTNVNLSNGGILDVSGTTSHAMTLSSGKKISGDGQVNGNFTVASGATLAPGNNDLGALSFSNALTLNAGSKTIINVSHDSQTNNVLFVAGTITWGGALVISNADDLLQAGDAFQLFSGPGFTGNFNSISLPTLTPGLYWNTNTFKTDATIRVLAETPPVIGSLGFANGKLAMSGSGGVTNGTYYVLTTTNLALPATNWTRLQTNQFDGNGNFSFTNTINPNAAQSFYLLQLP
jgi:autotransporter-associated beta strand protein